MDALGRFDGTTVFLELHESNRQDLQIDDIDTLEKLGKTVLRKELLAEAISILSDAVTASTTGQDSPSEIELETAFNVTAASSIVLVKGSANASFRLKMKWQKHAERARS